MVPLRLRRPDSLSSSDCFGVVEVDVDGEGVTITDLRIPAGLGATGVLESVAGDVLTREEGDVVGLA